MSKESVEALLVALNEWPAHMKLPEKFRDGSWWCMVQPGCSPLACCGHDTFEEAVLLSIANIRKLRAKGIEW